jgi:phosphoribosylformylglycinamidine (FGAM) synthase-like enzyme
VTITLLALDGTPAFPAVCESLTEALGRLATVARLGGDETSPEEYGALLDEAERGHDHVVLVAGAPALSLAGSAYHGLAWSPAGRPPELDLRAEAALVRFLWRAAPLLSLAHDVSRGGLAVALAEAALWSGVGAELDLPDDELALFGEGGGQAVLACAPENVERLGSKGLRRLGVVGGSSICGVELDELREARG